MRYVYFEDDDSFAEYRYNENGLRSLKKIYDEDYNESDYYYFWSDDGRLLAYTVDQYGADDLYSVLVLYNSNKEPIGFTVGDPFKDTSGPSINILIKLLSMVSIVFAAVVVKFSLL